MDKLHQINERCNHIKSLHQFVTNSKHCLSGILHGLDWNEQDTFFKEGEKSLNICPQNEEHRVGTDNFERHMVKCCWHQSGYRDDSLPLPEDYRSCATTILLDKNLQADVILKAAAQDPTIKIGENVRGREVPQTSDRVFSDFTTDERRVLYDYVVSRTSAAVPRLSDFILPSGEESKREPLTKEQLMIAERDAKRRRIRYRTAKVHTKSKNYSEIMREVINNQMLAYEDWLRDQSGITGPTPSIPTEKANTKESVVSKQEMVWLDWDYRTNPHVRWKHLVEQEKRRARKRETEKTSSSHDHKRRDKETSDSKRSSQNESRKYNHNENHHHKFENSLKEKDRERKMHVSQKDYLRGDSNRREKNIESTRKVKKEYDYNKYHQDIFKDYEKSDKERDVRNESDRDSRYKEYHSNSDYYKTYKYEDRHAFNHGKQYGEGDDKVKVKKEFEKYLHSSASISEHDIKKKQDLFHKSKYKEETDSTTESDVQSDKTSHTSRKRKKKSKKKHKKKHKSKRSRRKSSSESFD